MIRMKRFLKIGVIGLAIMMPVVVASAQNVVVDNLGKQTTVGKVEFAKLKRVTIKASDHGKDASFEGVLLSDVLKLGGVEFGENLRGKRMNEYLLVEAADGYKAVYALAELDAGFTDKLVVLADKRDGKELPENARSFQIVNDSDKRAARWVRQVTRLSIVKAGK